MQADPAMVSHLLKTTRLSFAAVFRGLCCSPVGIQPQVVMPKSAKLWHLYPEPKRPPGLGPKELPLLL